MKYKLNLLKESADGKLYESNGFLIPILAGSSKEMGAQYGALMVEHMEKAWDLLVAPGQKSGAIPDADVQMWAGKAYTT